MTKRSIIIRSELPKTIPANACGIKGIAMMWLYEARAKILMGRMEKNKINEDKKNNENDYEDEKENENNSD